MTLAPTAPPPVAVDSAAFLRAVTELGQQQPVFTSRSIHDEQGVKLLDAGVQIDAGLHDLLAPHRLSARLDESLVSEPTVSGAVLREAAEAVMLRQPFFGLMGPAGRARSMVLQAIESIPLPRPVALHLTVARVTRPTLFEHGLLMALLCAHLVREGGAPIHDMTVAASAGLLHDMGMLNIHSELLDAGNTLSGDERRPIYAHPISGSMLVARFAEYPKQVARAVFEHHERLDGSGYPRGLQGDAISPLGRMLSLAEVVTAMFDGRREYPLQRVSLSLRLSPHRFDPALVPSIHRLLRAAPAEAAEADLKPAESLARLKRVSELLDAWEGAAQAASTVSPVLDAAAQAVLDLATDQAQMLQRMLFDVGITAEQLGMLEAAEPVGQPQAIELWVLARELHWHLRTNAHQLQRRWRAVAGAPPIPQGLADWLGGVKALDAPA